MNSTTPSIQPRLVTEYEAAKYLGVSERTVFNLAANGLLKFVKIGAAKRYDVNDLAAFIEQAKGGPDHA